MQTLQNVLKNIILHFRQRCDILLVDKLRVGYFYDMVAQSKHVDDNLVLDLSAEMGLFL